MPGKTRLRTLKDDPSLEYFLYCPRRPEGAPLVVAVHGITRNAGQHAHVLAPFAAARGAALLAPLFSKPRFKDYQRLGRSGCGDRADLALQRIIREVTQGTGISSTDIRLFGFSGGAQFAHRYAMAHPGDVRAYALGAPGWFTFPDETQPYPWGTLPSPDLDGIGFALAEFLRIPGAVFVGERDRNPAATALNKTSRVLEQQGESRFERAQRWIAEMNRAARSRGYTTAYELHALPRSGHSFVKTMSRGDLGEKAFEFLFNAPAAGATEDSALPRSNSSTSRTPSPRSLVPRENGSATPGDPTAF